MRNLIFVTLLSAAQMAAISAVRAEDVDPASAGNAWHMMCNVGKSQRPGACETYVIGLVSGLVAQAGLTDTKLPYCAPKSANYLQYSDIFYKYLENHPESRHYDASAIAIYAWTQAFPCKK